MNEEQQAKLILGLLTRTLDVVADSDADAATFLLGVIHHAAHLAKDVGGEPIVTAFLLALAEHMPECKHQVIRISFDTAPTSATKH